jgi:hypothetical protein
MGNFLLLAAGLVGVAVVAKRQGAASGAYQPVARSNSTQSNPWDPMRSGTANEIYGAINAATGLVSNIAGLFGGKGGTPQPDPSYAFGSGGGGTGDGWSGDIWGGDNVWGGNDAWA